MSVTTHERPGVYSSYDASSVVSGSRGGKAVGIAAKSMGGTVGNIYHITRQEEAETAFGGADHLTELIRVLLLNGAGAVCAAPVGGESDYGAAFAKLQAESDLAVIVCDSVALSVQQALRESVKAAAQARHERIAVVGGGTGETVAQLVTRGEAINSERVVLVTPERADEKQGVNAAAVAGAIAAERDPAVPLGGAELRGVNGPAVQYGDGELDLLIRGGVTPLERVGGIASVVRGVTTRTKSGAAADKTWRELSTILIVDEVIPAIRDALRAKFQRAKNTAQSRGAVRAQVVLELENRVSREIIDGYENVTVSADAGDPTVCIVEFSFAVVHGMNQIWMTAHIKV
ncbi:MAG: phage tail sheath C-terminal domain-containing protein [Pseudoflavonifractor sp.]